MIVGVKRGAGGLALARHLADSKLQNESTLLGMNRKLNSDKIISQIEEIGFLAKPSKSSKPIYHVHADPSVLWSTEQWKFFWDKFEEEFNLEAQPFSEVVHEKYGRQHKHRVYSLFQPLTGRTLNFSHDFARVEKIASICEIKFNEKLTPRAHIKAILNYQPKLTKSLASISDVQPGPATSSDERQQSERTGISKEKVAQAVFRSWTTSDDGKSFEQALRASNLVLRTGEKTILVVDMTGNVHSLSRLLNLASKMSGQRIKANEIQARLNSLILETHKKGEKPNVGTNQEKNTVTGANDFQRSEGSQEQLSTSVELAGTIDRKTRTENREANGYNNPTTSRDFKVSNEVREKIGQATLEIAFLQRKNAIQSLRDISAELSKGKTEIRLYDQFLRLISAKEKGARFILSRRPFSADLLDSDVLIQEMIRAPMRRLAIQSEYSSLLSQKLSQAKRNLSPTDELLKTFRFKTKKMKKFEALCLMLEEAKTAQSRAENLLDTSKVRANFEAPLKVRERLVLVKSWENSPAVIEATSFLRVIDQIKVKAIENPDFQRLLVENLDKAIKLVLVEAGVIPKKVRISAVSLEARTTQHAYARPRL
jgi:hypothetical protein